MALTATFTADFGAAFEGAYIRIVTLDFNVRDNSMSFYVDIYVSQTAFLEGKPPITSKMYSWTGYDKAGANPHTQMYGYLLTLPEFAGAVPVYEEGQAP